MRISATAWADCSSGRSANRFVSCTAESVWWWEWHAGVSGRSTREYSRHCVSGDAIFRLSGRQHWGALSRDLEPISRTLSGERWWAMERLELMFAEGSSADE